MSHLVKQTSDPPESPVVSSYSADQGQADDVAAAHCNALWDSLVATSIDSKSEALPAGNVSDTVDAEHSALWDDIFELLNGNPLLKEEKDEERGGKDELNENCGQSKRKLCSLCDLNYYDAEKHICIVSGTDHLLWGGANENDEAVANESGEEEQEEEEEEQEQEQDNNPLARDEIEVYNDVVKEKRGDTGYVLRKTGQRNFAGRIGTQVTHKVTLKPGWAGKRWGNELKQLKKVFEEILTKVGSSADDEDVGNVIIKNESISDIIVPLRPWRMLNADTVMNVISKVLQSHENLEIDNGLEVIVGSIQLPRGMGMRKEDETIPYTLNGTASMLTIKSKTFMRITNTNNSCMYLAIVAAWLMGLKKIKSIEWEALMLERKYGSDVSLLQKLRDTQQCNAYTRLAILGEKKQQRLSNLASELCRHVGVDFERAGNLIDLQLFEQYLNVRVVVVSAGKGNKVIRSGVGKAKPLYLYLVTIKGKETESVRFHYHVIKNIQCLFEQAKFCDTCMRPFNRRQKHLCSSCLCCGRHDCMLDPKTTRECRNCFIMFKNEKCFQTHLSPRTPKALPQCAVMFKCPHCSLIVERHYKSGNKHICFSYFCTLCLRRKEAGHYCYNRALVAADNSKFKYLFFDFETRQDELHVCEKGYSPRELEAMCEDCDTLQVMCTACKLCQNCKKANCGANRHIVNYAVMQTCCNYCWESVADIATDRCENCGRRCESCLLLDRSLDTCGQCCQRQTVMIGEDLEIEIGDFLICRARRDFTMFAHNGQGYDFHFILRYLFASVHIPSVIYNGSKVMRIDVKSLGIKFLDSLNFLPMALSKIPEVFGLKEGLAKGYFPHFFNTVENQEYSGVYPAIEFYGAQEMNTESREKFLRWHESMEGKVFDFKHEMHEYCQADVTILREGCMQFRRLLLETAKVDPFRQTTLAGTSMAVWRQNFLEEKWLLKDGSGKKREARFKAGVYSEWNDSSSVIDIQGEYGKAFQSTLVGAIPSGGYVGSNQYSGYALTWLLWLEETENSRIDHAGNRKGEYRLLGTRYMADGICHETKTIYEYQSCWHHGCLSCFPNDREVIKNPGLGKSMKQLYQDVRVKRSVFEHRGYRWIEIWHCQFLHMLKTGPCRLKEILKECHGLKRLVPREAFFGGRVNATRLYCKAEKGQKIKYVDYTSLYPYICKTAKYPCGHPEIITSDFKSLENYFGLFSVTMLAPHDLFHPVLPTRVDGKLMFHLCTRCARERLPPPCSCTDAQRYIKGTFCSPEVMLALEKNYKLIKVHEVYHFEQSTSYCEATGEKGLFSEFIDCFLKIKQQASSWPKGCLTEEDKTEYIDKYFEVEGIRLDRTKIPNDGMNKGLRAISKLLLNAHWGRFGMDPNKSRCEIIKSSNAEKLFQLISDHTKTLISMDIVNEDTMLCCYKSQTPYVKTPPNTNLFLAIFTAGNARIKLFRDLDKLGPRCVYYDTDSLIYTVRENEEDLILGDHLGQLTDELGGDTIDTFICSGPKSYCYTTVKSGHTTVKVKGFTLSYSNARKITFSSICELLKEEVRVSSSNEELTLSGQSNSAQKKVKQNSRKKARSVNYADQEEEEVEDKSYIVTEIPRKICLGANKTSLVLSKHQTKKFKFVYSKRHLIRSSLETLPFGWRGEFLPQSTPLFN